MLALAPETLQCVPGLESGPNRHFAAGLQYAGGRTQVLCMELWVAHAATVANHVGGMFCRFIGGADMGRSALMMACNFPLSSSAARRSHGLASRLCAKDRLSGSVQPAR